MTTDKILHAELIDIIFEERNKLYGAYTLRKYYRERVIKSLAITFSVTALLCLLLLIKPAKTEFITEIFDVPTGRKIPPANPEPEKPKKNQQKPRPATAVAKPSQKFNSNMVLTDNPVEPIVNLDDSLAIDSENVAGEPDIFVRPADPIPADPIPGLAALPAVDRVTPTSTAEVMPSYPGGIEALRKFLIRNLQNPQELEAGESISVKVRFVVGYDGKLKGFQTVEDGGAVFNNEVVRVLKKMPVWTPGKTNGENVSVYYTIPVKFTATE